MPTRHLLSVVSVLWPVLLLAGEKAQPPPLPANRFPEPLRPGEKVSVENILIGEHSGIKIEEIEGLLLGDAAFRETLIKQGDSNYRLDVSLNTCLFDDGGQSDRVEVKIILYRLAQMKPQQFARNRDLNFRGKDCQRAGKCTMTIQGHPGNEAILDAVRCCADIALRAIRGANKPVEAKPTTVDEVVGQIVQHAKANDKRFFAKYLAPSYKGLENQIIEEIKASGMADNYKTRLTDVSESRARLDYHYTEKGCHFQVALEKQDGSWILKSIWPCR